MRVLWLSEVYSTPRVPKRGVPNARIAHAMRAFADVRVMSPVPWYPRAVSERVPRMQHQSGLPPWEVDVDGGLVSHPRRLHLPRIYSVHAMLYALSLFKPLREEVARWRPDVLLSAWAFPDGAASVALGKLLGIPTVVRVMGSDINDYAHHQLRRQQISLGLRHASRVIAVSGALRGEVLQLGVDPAQVVVIPTGVDRGSFHAVDRREAAKAIGAADAPLIVVPSRLSHEKGIHHFIAALAKMAPEVHAVLVGDGSEEASLRAQVDRMGLSARVRFAGFQPEERMKMFYSAADVVCLPSLEEGWPNVLMESFACGCPVVASDVGGVAEIVRLTGAGILAAPGDEHGLSAALAEGLARSWDREETAHKMEHHSLRVTAERYAATCTEVQALPSVA